MDSKSAAVITDYYDLPPAAPAQSAGADALDKYAKSGLGADMLDRYRSRLVEIMRDERLYLSPDLTLPALAERVGCSVNHLSQVINAGFGVSFFDYLNRYRVEFAEQMLADPASADSAILEIAFAAGFNSNSAFYTAFRKKTGETPARFRRRQAPTPRR